jgi:hypothetical protein
VKPTISILHPTARVKPAPLWWKTAHDQLLASCENPQDVEYVLVVHKSRKHLLEGTPSDRWGAVRVVTNRERDCVVDQNNAAAAECTGDIIIGIMDDLAAPELWDTKLHILCPDPQKPWAIDITGEETPWLVYGGLTRARYQQQGHLLNPVFTSMYADNWFSRCAYADGVVLNGRGHGWKHHHYLTGANKEDDVYRMQNAPTAYRDGKAAYEKLIAEDRPVLAVCLPGETFHAYWFSSWMKLYGGLCQSGAFGQIQLHTSFTTDVYHNRNALAGDVMKASPMARYVLWMDDDNVLTAQQFFELYRVLYEQPDMQMVAAWAWCRLRGGGYMLSFGNWQDNGQTISAEEDALTGNPETVGYTGFPAVLMRSGLLQRLSPAPFSKDIFLHPGAGEDAAFCRRAYLAGYPPVVHTGIRSEHLKVLALPGPSLHKGEK